MEQIYVQVLLDKVAQLMRPDIKKTNIQFTYECSSDYLTLQADVEMIEQVLMRKYDHRDERR